ncbi:hypothetical protein HK102_007061 [Quaeritorhiza haematococci]|nr:hypothetical protein HK102_007061 [Quaeritorhiza haematococci]
MKTKVSITEEIVHAVDAIITTTGLMSLSESQTSPSSNGSRTPPGTFHAATMATEFVVELDGGKNATVTTDGFKSLSESKASSSLTKMMMPLGTFMRDTALASERVVEDFSPRRVLPDPVMNRSGKKETRKSCPLPKLNPQRKNRDSEGRNKAESNLRLMKDLEKGPPPEWSGTRAGN